MYDMYPHDWQPKPDHESRQHRHDTPDNRVSDCAPAVQESMNRRDNGEHPQR